MNKLTNKDYQVVADKLVAAGYTVETVYAALEAAGFKIELNGEVYKVYASRILAIMHSEDESGPAIKL